MKRLMLIAAAALLLCVPAFAAPDTASLFDTDELLHAVPDAAAKALEGLRPEDAEEKQISLEI